MRLLACAAIAVCACGRISFDARLDSGDGATPMLAVPDASMLPNTAVRLTPSDPAAKPTWSALDGGTIDSQGVFTAPATTGDFHILATLGAQSVTVTVHVVLPTSTSTIDANGTPDASGMAHQHHGAYVDGTWWVWYASTTSTNAIASAHSPDGLAWTSGAQVTSTDDIGAIGRNLDVAVGDFGGHHVVHMAASYENGKGHYHIRATLDNGSLLYGTPKKTNSGGNTSPDGPSTVVLASGLVIDGTGYEATPQTPPLSPCGDGDVEMFAANTLEDGSGAFEATTWTRTVIWCVPVRVNARRLLSDGTTIFELYDDGVQEPSPDNIYFNVRQPGGAWLPDETIYTTPPSVFATNTTFDLNDWSATIVGRQIHAVRRLDATTYEHRVYDLDAATPWTAGAPIAADNGVVGSGVVVVRYGEGVLLVTISPDGTHEIHYTFWNGSTWLPWTKLLAGFDPNRTYLAAVERTGGAPLLLWTSGSSLKSLPLP